VAEYLADDVVMRGTVGGLDEQLVLEGREAAVGYFREIVEPWDELKVEILRVVEQGDRFVLLMRETGRTTRAAIEISRDTAFVGRIADGRVAEMRGYLDQAAALEAAGVS
jgi:ketosteroid isomerase-like protein